MGWILKSNQNCFLHDSIRIYDPLCCQPRATEQKSLPNIRQHLCAFDFWKASYILLMGVLKLWHPTSTLCVLPMLWLVPSCPIVGGLTSRGVGGELERFRSRSISSSSDHG
jgi:hypothetical protein